MRRLVRILLLALPLAATLATLLIAAATLRARRSQGRPGRQGAVVRLLEVQLPLGGQPPLPPRSSA